MACMVTLAACNLDYHEYANYGKDYIDESYENVIGMITNVYSILDYDFGQTYKGGMLASACDEAEYAYTNNDICDFVNGSWSPANPMSNIWTSSYKAIQICNQYLAEFQGLTFDELKLNDDYRAQMFRYRRIHQAHGRVKCYASPPTNVQIVLAEPKTTVKAVKA